MADSTPGRRSIRGLKGVGLVTLAALAWPVACRAPSEPHLEPHPPRSTRAAFTATPSAAAAATASGSTTASASAPAPASQPIRDPGPGGIACGAVTCQAGIEVCAPQTACGPGWPAMGCLTVAELRARSFGPGTPCANQCYAHFDQKACDGAGDCGPGEACCRDVGIVPCSGSDMGAGATSEQACAAAVSGRTPCHLAEVCSAADRICRRKGASCVLDEATGLGTCEVPRPVPKCAIPCPEGLTCVAPKLGGPGECGLQTFQCERGNQCAPDEACFSLTHQCALGSVAFPGTEQALCVDASDCVGYCGDRDLAFCLKEDAGDEDGACECLARCRRDQDCSGHIDCAQLGIERFGAATLLTTPFCDQAHGRCDCR